MMLFSSRTASGTALTTVAQQQMLRKLTEIFQSSPENQCCADCRSRLSDSIWASTTVGAFLCIHCAGCHRKLGVQLSRVKSLHLDSWSDEEVLTMKAGNKRVQEVYGKHADKWIAVDPSFVLQSNADISARERYIRAKYEGLQFTKMPTSPETITAHIRSEEKGQDSPELTDDSPASPMRRNQQNSPAQKPVREGNQNAVKSGRVVEVSKRFLNYFMVLGRGSLVPNQHIEKSKSPTDIQFFPTTIDVFPEPHHDSPLPSHLTQFAFPEGFSLSQAYVAPIFFSFVLTNVNGVKIYACALKFYEELHPLEVVSLLAPHYNHPHRHQRRRPGAGAEYPKDDNNDNQSGELPKWVQDLSGEMAQAPGPVFCPKCIIVTSHYPYFSAFRQFLQQVKFKLLTGGFTPVPFHSHASLPITQIYRATLSQSPMPVERYIANFVSEIPLPPPGQIQVQLTLPDRTLIVSRPPKNDFPLVDFSFRPLFQVMDLNNVLLVFSSETLLALLLPYLWQGAYIPVLPASLLDVIDVSELPSCFAPVPFLVGTHSDCLKQAAARTTGVIFVDLDHNRVIPAVDESGKAIPIPKLPEREGAKLRVKLAEYANAFPNEEHLEPIGSFATERGQTVPLAKTVSETSSNDSFTSIYSMGKIMRGRKNSNSNPAPSPSGSSSAIASISWTSKAAHQASPGPSAAADTAGGLTDSRFNESDNFSTEGIRKAFLRFFVTLFKKYAQYLNMSPRNGKNGNESLFDGEAFLRDNYDAMSRPFMAQLIATQMFDRFVEDRVFNPQFPEVLFFDQSINQKLNRSLSIGKKKYDCSFLDDRSDDIQETFIAPPPSNIGLPDDGTIYNYKAFPRLKK
uniref:Arf-GAP domain-containing protein n=1 Tax=Globisporangium ultimum (strain ATCC 200006 / CBS 805.95 / DAOM BR144) TaxID=431595 RepID=K3W6U9_GLOUD